MGAPLRGKRPADETKGKLGKARASKKPRHEDLCVDEVMLDVVEEDMAKREKCKRETRSKHEYGPPEKKLRLETWRNQEDGKQLRWPLEGRRRVGNLMLHLENQVVDLQSQLEVEKVACNSLREQLDLRAVAEMELRERAGMAEACAMETELACNGLKQENEKLKLQVDQLNSECEAEKEKTLCCICYEKSKNILMLPCQHLIACRDCALRIQAENNRCPTCREPIEMIMECFWSSLTRVPPTISSACAAALEEGLGGCRLFHGPSTPAQTDTVVTHDSPSQPLVSDGGGDMDEAVREYWIKVAVVPAKGVSPTWFEESLFTMRMQDTLHLRKVYHAFSEQARTFLGEGAQGEVIQRRVRFNFVRGREHQAKEKASLKEIVYGVVLVSDSDSNLDMEGLETSFRNVKEKFPHSMVEQYLIVHEDATVKQCWLQDGALFSSPSDVPMVTAMESIATLLVQEIGQRMSQAAPGDPIFDSLVDEHLLELSSVAEREIAEQTWKEVQKKLFHGEAQLLVNNGIASLSYFDSAEEKCRMLGVDSLLPFIAERRLVATMILLLDRGSHRFETREIHDLQILFQECIAIHLRMNEPTEAVRLNLIFCKVLVRGDQGNRDEAVSFLNETQQTLQMMPRAKGYLWIQSEVCLLYMELGAWRKACYHLAQILKSMPNEINEEEYRVPTCKNISKLWQNLVNRGEGLSLFRWPGVALGFLRQLSAYSAENHTADLQWNTFSHILKNQHKYLDRSSQLLVWKHLLDLCKGQPEMTCQRAMLLGMTEPIRLAYHEPCAPQAPETSGSQLFIVNSMDKLKQQESLHPQLVEGDTFTVVVRVKNPLRVKAKIRHLGIMFKGVRVVCSTLSLKIGPLEETQAFFNARAVEGGSMDIVGCSMDVDGMCWDEIWTETCSEGKKSTLERMHNIPVRQEEPSISASATLPSRFHALDLYAGQELDINVALVNTGHMPASLRQISARKNGSSHADALDVSHGKLPESLHPGQHAVVALKIHIEANDASIGKTTVQVHVDYVRLSSKSNACLRRATTSFNINIKPAMISTNQFPIKARASAASEVCSDWGRVLQVENETKRELEVSVVAPVQTASDDAPFVLSPRAQKCILIERQKLHPNNAQMRSSGRNGIESASAKPIRQKKLVWSFVGADNKGSLDISTHQAGQEKPSTPGGEPALGVLISQVPWHGSNVDTLSGQSPTVKIMDPIGFRIQAKNNSCSSSMLRVTLSPHSAPDFEGPSCPQSDNRSFPAAMWHGVKDTQPILVAGKSELEHDFGMVFLKPGVYCVNCFLEESSEQADDGERHSARSFCSIHVVH